MELRKLQQLAGSRNSDDYLESGRLLDLCVDEVRGLLRDNRNPTPEHFVAAVLNGLTAASVKGLISMGDEHEWAVLTLAAVERAWAVPRKFRPCGDPTCAACRP